MTAVRTAPLREPWPEACERIASALAWSKSNGGPIDGWISGDGEFAIRRPWKVFSVSQGRAPSKALTGRIVPGTPGATVEIAHVAHLGRIVAWGAAVWVLALAAAVVAAGSGVGFGLEPVLLFVAGGALLVVAVLSALQGSDRGFLLGQLEEILGTQLR